MHMHMHLHMFHSLAPQASAHTHLLTPHTAYASRVRPGGGALTAAGLLPRATRLLAAGDTLLAAGDTLLAAGGDARAAISSLKAAGTI